MAIMATEFNPDESRFDEIIDELADAYRDGNKEQICKLEWEYENVLAALDANRRDEQKINENWMYE